VRHGASAGCLPRSIVCVHTRAATIAAWRGRPDPRRAPPPRSPKAGAGSRVGHGVRAAGARWRDRRGGATLPAGPRSGVAAFRHARGSPARAADHRRCRALDRTGAVHRASPRRGRRVTRPPRSGRREWGAGRRVRCRGRGGRCPAPAIARSPREAPPGGDAPPGAPVRPRIPRVACPGARSA
jgi:hypothetical protein